MARTENVFFSLKILKKALYIFRFVYDGDTLALKRTLDLPRPIGEGWGLTHRIEDGKYKLYVTDGSNKVFVVDPETMAIENTIEVNERENLILIGFC